MNIGVLGMGSIGQRHARNLEQLGHTIMPYDPARYGYEREDVLSGCDAFVISSPTAQHYQDILDVAPLVKPILIEKPIVSPNRYELDHITEVLTGRNDVFMGFNLRFHPCVQAAHYEVVAGALKSPQWAHFCIAQHTDKEPYLRDGVVSNWASHEIDLALHLLGPAKVVAAAGNDTICDIIMRHDNGCQTAVHADYVSKPEMRYFTIFGPQGMLANLVARDVTLDGAGRDVYKTTFDDDYRLVAQTFHFAATAPQGSIAYRKLAKWHDGVNVCDIVIQARERMGL